MTDFRGRRYRVDIEHLLPERRPCLVDEGADAEIHMLDAGHFALETRHWEVARLMLDFVRRKIGAGA